VGSRAPSKIEAQFAIQLRGLKLDNGMEREWKFHPKRRWRFDFAWPARMVAVELEGWAAFQGHASLEGFQTDCEKYNSATELGWRVFRFTGRQVRKGQAYQFMERVLDDAA
jgi:very-short-patch-repair endonuclease